MQTTALGLLLFSSMSSVGLLAQGPTPTQKAENVSTAVADLRPPSEPCTEAQIREYAKLTGSDAIAHKLMAQMLKGMRGTANPVIPPSVWDEMDAEFANVDLLAGAIPAYQRYLSREDMDAVLTFYRSGPGRRILAAQPFIIAASQDSGRKLGESISLKIVERHKDEIAARQRKLDQEAAARSGSIQLNVAPPPVPPSVETATPPIEREPK